MGIMELGAIGELVGGVAVVASLIYVGLQVRQSTLAQNTAAGEFTVTNLVDVQNAIARNADLSKIVMGGGLDPSNLPLQDRFRFNLIARTMFIQVDIARLKRQDGLIDDSLWHTALAFFDDTIRASGMQQWWTKNAHQFSPTMRDFVERRIRTADAQSPTASDEADRHGPEEA